MKFALFIPRNGIETQRFQWRHWKKKIISLRNFFWFKKMIHLKEMKIVRFTQIMCNQYKSLFISNKFFICLQDILIESNKFELFHINQFFKLKKSIKQIICFDSNTIDLTGKYIQLDYFPCKSGKE